MRSAGVWTWEQMQNFVNELAEFREKNKDWLLVSPQLPPNFIMHT